MAWWHPINIPAYLVVRVAAVCLPLLPLGATPMTQPADQAGRRWSSHLIGLQSCSQVEGTCWSRRSTPYVRGTNWKRGWSLQVCQFCGNRLKYWCSISGAIALLLSEHVYALYILKMYALQKKKLKKYVCFFNADFSYTYCLNLPLSVPFWMLLAFLKIQQFRQLQSNGATWLMYLISRSSSRGNLFM